MQTNRPLTGSIDLGNGFTDHGVAMPIANHRGIVATVDGGGRNVVLLWLYDTRGGYALLLIDAETGRSEQIPMPFDPGGDGPFASILSSGNRFYTHFNSHFCEFDPACRAFTFCAETVPQMAMSMTEDDRGRIWSVTYPDSGVVRFDPTTRAFRDYGHVYRQDWRQYQRTAACDATGRLYFGVGSTRSQIVTLDPDTGVATPLIDEDERVQGSGFVYRNLNGRVYGHGGDAGCWFELYGGEKRRVGAHEIADQAPIITGSQGLCHRLFPDGRVLRSCSLVERVLRVEDPQTGETTTASFDYETSGAHVMGVCAAPDRTVCGGTAFPMRFFRYDPGADRWEDRPAFGQFNTTVVQGDRVFVGGYGHGFLLEWDPARPWADTEKAGSGNPRWLAEAHPDINRPHALVATDRFVIMAGTPGYGYTGGGLLVWDRDRGEAAVIPHGELVPDQAPMSLAVLPDGTLLAGTTVAPGTGGRQKAEEAELFRFDPAATRLTWRAKPLAGVTDYTDLHATPEGLVYGLANSTGFFVFDSRRNRVIHERDIGADHGPAVRHQGTRAFVPAPDGTVYLLLNRGVALVEPDTFAIRFLAEAPVPIQQGGAILEGRLYFIRHSRLYSWRLPPAEQPRP